MELTEEIKKGIDNRTYEEMLRKVRFAPAGHIYFQRGEVATYFSKRMNGLKKTTDHVQASKNIGW